MIAPGHRHVGVVETARGLAVHVKPPVALEDRLIEDGGLGAQEALHDQAVVGEGANVEDLWSVRFDLSVIL